jgi:hypothetical protein
VDHKRSVSIVFQTPLGITLGFLTSLLGQVAPSSKHLAWTLWMPKESMPATAARIEVVFILLVGLSCCRCLRYGIRVVLEILLRMIEERGTASRSRRFLLYMRSTSVECDRRACCGQRGISLYRVQLLAEWSFSEFCVTILPPFTPCRACHAPF